VLLGVKDLAPDHRSEGGRARRFATWAVLAKQKAATAVWQAWKAQSDELAADGATTASPAKKKK